MALPGDREHRRDDAFATFPSPFGLSPCASRTRARSFACVPRALPSSWTLGHVRRCLASTFVKPAHRALAVVVCLSHPRQPLSSRRRQAAAMGRVAASRARACRCSRCRRRHAVVVALLGSEAPLPCYVALLRRRVLPWPRRHRGLVCQRPRACAPGPCQAPPWPHPNRAVRGRRRRHQVDPPRQREEKKERRQRREVGPPSPCRPNPLGVKT
jgi:hypothetical protein